MKRLLITMMILAACSTPPQPAPQAAPPEAPGQEPSIGAVKVTANTLNVRREASASSEVIAQVRKGERLALLSSSNQWDRIRLGTGEIGFVSVDHVIREGVRARRGCPADSDYQFTKTPTPAFSDSSAHGVVTVEANVDKSGNVTSTKLISNTTGEEALSVLAEREIRDTKFSPPIRNCVPKAFIFTYKRAF